MKRLAILLVRLPAALGAQQNMIPNGDFDTPSLGWWNLPVEVDTIAVHSTFGNPAGSLLIESALDPPEEPTSRRSDPA